MPAETMKSCFGTATIIAIDGLRLVTSVKPQLTVIASSVGAKDKVDIYNYGDEFNGWFALFRRLNPFASKTKIPSLPEVIPILI